MRSLEDIGTELTSCWSVFQAWTRALSVFCCDWSSNFSNDLKKGSSSKDRSPFQTRTTPATMPTNVIRVKMKYWNQSCFKNHFGSRIYCKPYRSQHASILFGSPAAPEEGDDQGQNARNQNDNDRTGGKEWSVSPVGSESYHHLDAVLTAMP